jgi:hypothetical protein
LRQSEFIKKDKESLLESTKKEAIDKTKLSTEIVGLAQDRDNFKTQFNLLKIEKDSLVTDKQNL